MALPARKATTQPVALATALAYRQRCQRLDQRTPEPLVELVSALGGVPCPGGATPYLALHARSPRIDRRLVDRALHESALAELPFARGQSLLATAADVPAVLALGRDWHERRVRPLREAGAVDERRLARCKDAVRAALAGGPLAADDLRARLPEAVCPALGEAGRKLGLPSLFSLTLQELRVEGALARASQDGRLDRAERLWAAAPFAAPRMAPGQALELLAARFFRAHAPAPLPAFAHWADVGLAEARLAVGAAGLTALAVEGEREPWYLGPEQLEELWGWPAPVPARLAFVPFEDPFLAGARDLRSLLPEARRGAPFADARGRLSPAGGAGPVHQHLVLQGGRVAGAWEYDEDARRVRYATFEPLPTRMRRAADDQADEVAAFIASDLGQARFHAADEGDDFPGLDALVAAWGKARG